MNFIKDMKWSPLDYAEACVIARESGQEMLNRLDWMTLKPKIILDAGCGTGEMARLLTKRYPEAKVLACDIEENMVSFACQDVTSSSFFCADGLHLPLREQSVDLIFANLVFPWQGDFRLTFEEWRRVLKPDGLLMFTALGLDTLQEWRNLAANQIPLLIDMHDVGDLLLETGFADPVLDVSYITTTYRDTKQLLHDLCVTGMLKLDGTTQAEMQSATPTAEGKWQVTYEIIFGHAFQPPLEESDSKQNPGEVKVPLSHLRESLRAKK